MKFSVLLPVYAGDHPEHLSEALLSTVSQTIMPNEIVIVKDGPLTKELEDYISLFCKNYDVFRVISLEKNQGLALALNYGIIQSSYDWIFRMDADDICVPHRFETQCKFIENNPEVKLVGSNIEEYDFDMKTFISYRNLPTEHNEIVKYAKWRCPFNHMTVAYNKQAIIEVGLYNNFKAVGEDYDLWARVIMTGYKVGNINQSLVHARTGLEFFERRRGWKYLKTEIKVLNSIYRTGFFNIFHWIIHFIIKCTVRLSPKWIIRYTYHILRYF